MVIQAHAPHRLQPCHIRAAVPLQSSPRLLGPRRWVQGGAHSVAHVVHWNRARRTSIAEHQNRRHKTCAHMPTTYPAAQQTPYRTQTCCNHSAPAYPMLMHSVSARMQRSGLCVLQCCVVHPRRRQRHHMDAQKCVCTARRVHCVCHAAHGAVALQTRRKARAVPVERRRRGSQGRRECYGWREACRCALC